VAVLAVEAEAVEMTLRNRPAQEQVVLAEAEEAAAVSTQRLEGLA
jgi:hypothetical protein